MRLSEKIFIFLVFLFNRLFSFDPVEVSLIKSKTVKKNTVYFHLDPKFTKKYVKQTLHISYPSDINLETLPSSILDIPLISQVIAVIWFSGEHYTLDEMDEDFYHSLMKVKAFFKRFFYNTKWDGELYPKKLIKNQISSERFKSASLFTGGLDSTATVFRHFHEKPVLISFNAPHETAVEFAKMHNLDFCTIYMNHDIFLKLTDLDKAACDISKWFWDTSMGLAWVGAAAPFLYLKGIPILYIPSGFTWRSFLFPDGQTLRQPASPLIDENLSPMGIQVKHDCFTMTRTDKMQWISQFCSENGVPKPQLVVCNRHQKASVNYAHCNRCTKCLLTMLDILAIGENLEDYGFRLSKEQFMQQFRAYLTDLKMGRGGTYAACYDTQCYLKKNIEKLPQAHRAFYEWFIGVNLYEKIKAPLNCPPRTVPFRWKDYCDLYSEAENFTN